MKIYWIIVVLLGMAFGISFQIRRARVRKELQLRMSLIKCFILGILVGASIWFLYSGDIWRSIKFK